jgi:hypothetical protein
MGDFFKPCPKIEPPKPQTHNQNQNIGKPNNLKVFGRNKFDIHV